MLVSEGVDGTRHAAERACYSSDILPEDLGKETAEMLMQDIVMVSHIQKVFRLGIHCKNSIVTTKTFGLSAVD